MPADPGLFSHLSLSPEQESFLADVDAACQQIRDSEEDTWLEETFNADRVPVFADANLLGIPIEEKYGGRGMDAVTNALALMRIGMEGAALRTFFSVHVNIGQFPIHLWGTDEQKERYLTKTTAGEMLAGFALTEPNAGSDPSSMETTFRKDGDTYVINGTKTWIGNATKGDVFSLFAKHEETGRVAAFIVEKDFDGLSTEQISHKMGYRNSDHGTIHLNDCAVPAENLLGPEEKGLTVAYTTLINGRLSVAAGSVGVIQDCLNEAMQYAKERRQWGEEIAHKQNVQLHIGRMAVAKDTTMAATLRAAEAVREYLADRGTREKRDRADYLASVAKVHNTEAAFNAADRAVQVFGSKGYTLENRVARHFVDERATRIYEGTTEIHLLKLAAEQLGKEFSTFGKIATEHRSEDS